MVPPAWLQIPEGWEPQCQAASSSAPTDNRRSPEPEGSERRQGTPPGVSRQYSAVVACPKPNGTLATEICLPPCTGAPHLLLPAVLAGSMRCAM
jgi:hypothetical protein